MKQIIDKESVEKAIADLKANGKKVTLMALHGALGHRGSMSTLVKIKAELEANAQPVNDSEEGLQAFREIWALAREEGRRQQESVNAGLQQDIQTLARENERLEGEATASANQASEVQKAKLNAEAALDDVKRQLARSQESLIQANKETQAALEKFAAEQTAHQGTHQELKTAIEKAHELELNLVRARALLDAQDGQNGVAAAVAPITTRGKSPRNG
jgi:chromosome segregation ATPase